MGASASVSGDVLEAEAARPLDASDVNTPRGESAKQEVARLRMLLATHLSMSDVYATDSSVAVEGTEYVGAVPSPDSAAEQTAMAPGLEAYLASVFRAADVDESGVLSAAEFWQLLQGSELGLTPAQIVSLQQQTQWGGATDGGECGDVTWATFVELAPQILANLFAGGDSSEALGEAGAEAAVVDDASDWCALSTAEGTTYYYNKRTQASAWEPPVSWASAS
jgi:hypothetical protein